MNYAEQFRTMGDSEILANVLAILNGDGGHYQAKHGAPAAAARGLERFHSWVAGRDPNEDPYNGTHAYPDEL